MGTRNRAGAVVSEDLESKTAGQMPVSNRLRILFDLSLKRVIGSLSTVPAYISLIAYGVITRLFTLGSERLWYDETFTARVVAKGTDFWQAIKGDTHPPFWSLVEYFNVRLFGSSEFSLRLPAAICGILTILVIWRIAIQLKFSRRAAFGAGLITALLPSAIYFSQDNRMYALLALSVLFGLWMALRGNWYLFFVAGLIAVYAQNIGLIYIFLIASAGAYRADIEERAKIAVCLAFILLLWSPWAIEVINQALRLKSGGFWAPVLSLPGLAWPYLLTSIGWRIPDALQLHLYMAAALLSIIGLIAARRWIVSRAGFIVLAAFIFTPLAFGAFCLLFVNVWVFRAMLPSGLLLALIWAYAASHLSVYNARVYLAILAPVLAIGLLAYYRPSENARVDVVAWLAPIYVEPASVFYLNASDEIQYSHYLPGIRSYVMPSQGNLISVTSETRAAFGQRLVNLWRVPDRALWVIFTESPFSDSRKLAFWRELLRQPGIRLIKVQRSKLISTYMLRFTRDAR